MSMSNHEGASGGGSGGGGGGGGSPAQPHSPTNGGSFQRIPSESSIQKPVKPITDREMKPGKVLGKPWERSQSAMDLEKKMAGAMGGEARYQSTQSVEYGEPGGGKVSEQSRVYWDLSQAADGGAEMHAAHGGKFKISLQTIHQKEEMKTTKSSTPSVSIQARLVRRMSSETQLIPSGANPHEYTLTQSSSNGEDNQGSTPSPGTQRAQFSFSVNGQPNLTVTLSKAVPVMQENISKLQAESPREQLVALRDMLGMIEGAWATPTIGRDLAYGLCDVLRERGGLEILIQNCNSAPQDVRLGSARVLEQSMTVGNREYVADKGLEVVVQAAKSHRDDHEMTKATVGILESLFKHSEDTCTRAIKLGGLDSILYSCRNVDKIILRHCAVALANLAIYGGQDNQQEMIAHKVPEWLFPLAFSNDDSIRYYAFLAIAGLSANRELEAAVLKSGTLQLVEPFIRTHDPVEFANSDKAHIHGQSKDWLRHLVPILSSKREEAQSLAAFHFAMEAGIKQQQGHLEVQDDPKSNIHIAHLVQIFNEIGAIEPLKQLASSTNRLASKFASQALKIIGEDVPFKLPPQAPLWTTDDVTHWLQQCGFSEYDSQFKESLVDGDLLLTLMEDNLTNDLNMSNGITRKRFLRELTRLKKTTEYNACDPSRLADWLTEMGTEFKQYTYQMIKSGADRRILRWLTDDHLLQDCGISNGIHRMKIIEGAKRLTSLVSTPMSGFDYSDSPFEKSIDVFISYRRSNGSQLASLLKVHLQLRGLTVFLDIEKLRAGKFDDNLLNSVRNARNFILVLTPQSLDRCVGDNEHKDWVHREVVAAIEGGCNIIPVMDSFQWPAPESLPEDMRPICYFNGIRWIHDYQDACVDKLEKFITGELSTRAGSRPPLSKGNSLNSPLPAPEMHGPVFSPQLERRGHALLSQQQQQGRSFDDDAPMRLLQRPGGGGSGRSFDDDGQPAKARPGSFDSTKSMG